MNNWYTVKVKFTKEFQDGTLKRVTEPYLVSSLSFTEAEARIYQEVGEFVRGEFLVTSISKTDFNALMNKNSKNKDLWKKLLEAFVIQQMERETDLLTTSPEARYQRILKRSPQVFQEIPHKYIASYLRMSPETLSRLKKS